MTRLKESNVIPPMQGCEKFMARIVKKRPGNHIVTHPFTHEKKARENGGMLLATQSSILMRGLTRVVRGGAEAVWVMVKILTLTLE